MVRITEHRINNQDLAPVITTECKCHAPLLHNKSRRHQPLRAVNLLQRNWLPEAQLCFPGTNRDISGCGQLNTASAFNVHDDVLRHSARFKLETVLEAAVPPAATDVNASVNILKLHF